MEREDLIQTVTEGGELVSNKNDFISNSVNHEALTGSKTTIDSVVPDGKHVEKGEVVMMLDASKLHDLKRKQSIIRDKAQNDYIFAKSQLQIIMKQGATDLGTARRVSDQARRALEKFKDGDYPQQLKDVDSRLLVSESELEQVRDNTAYVDRMVRKKFMSPSQARAAQSRLLGSEEALKKLQEERRVLVDFTYPQTMEKLQGEFDDAQANLKRLEIQTEAQRVQAENDLKTKEMVYNDEVKKFEEIESEIKHCVIRAPRSGLVVYYASQQSRRGSGQQQSIIAEGEQVYIGQKLMQIPDLQDMLINVRIHEALESKVKKGQRAVIRPHGFPDKILKGVVRHIANVATQQDWFSGDVKYYEAVVEVLDEIPGLKPGMSANVTIYTDIKADNVLTVPIQAIVREHGDKLRHKVYVQTPEGIEERYVTVGLSNDKKVEIVAGLVEGDEVILNVEVVRGDKNGATGSEGSPGKDRKRGGGGGQGGQGGSYGR